jgi:hypothetical protein
MSWVKKLRYLYSQCSNETVVAVEFHPLDPGIIITCGKGRKLVRHFGFPF